MQTCYCIDGISSWTTLWYKLHQDLQVSRDAPSTRVWVRDVVHTVIHAYKPCLSYEERHITVIWIIAIQLLLQDRPAPSQKYIWYLHIFQNEDNRKHLVQVQNTTASNLPGLLMNISSDIVPRHPRGVLWLLLGVARKENTMAVQGLHVPSLPLKAKEEHLSTVWMCAKFNINVHDSYWNLYYLNYLFLCYSEGQLTEIKHRSSWYSLLELQQ